MYRLLSLTFCLLFSSTALTKITSTPEKALVIGGGEISKRVCYYEDKSYSEGAVLQIGDHYIICDKANSFETNGALKWQTLKTKADK